MLLESFWNIIAYSWKDSPELDKQREQAITSNNEELLQDLSMELQGEILKNFNVRLSQLTKDELTSFIHHLEERIYYIDREEIQAFTDGSDDGFLYCRCFIVGMGERYYEMVDKDPSKAAMDVEAELFGFLAYRVYKKKFGEEFKRYAHHSMETCSNKSKWSI